MNLINSLGVKKMNNNQNMLEWLEKSIDENMGIYTATNDSKISKKAMIKVEACQVVKEMLMNEINNDNQQ